MGNEGEMAVVLVEPAEGGRERAETEGLYTSLRTRLHSPSCHLWLSPGGHLSIKWVKYSDSKTRYDRYLPLTRRWFDQPFSPLPPRPPPGPSSLSVPLSVPLYP